MEHKLNEFGEPIDFTAALEDVMMNATIDIKTFSDLLLLKPEYYKSIKHQMGESISLNTPKKEKPPVTISGGTNETSLNMILDNNKFWDLVYCEYEKDFFEMISYSKRFTLPNQELNIYSSLESFNPVILAMMGLHVFNSLDLIQSNKIYHLTGMASFADMMVVSKCQSLNVSKFGAIFIHDIVSDNFPYAINDLIKEFILEQLNVWVAKGLFTSEEVNGLFEDTATSHIYISAPEIKERLGIS